MLQLAWIWQQFTDNDGAALSAGKVFTYIAGTANPATTYQDAAGAVEHSNPITLDANGFPPSGRIFLSASTEYKFVVKDYQGATLKTIDDIAGAESGGGGVDSYEVKVNGADPMAAFLEDKIVAGAGITITEVVGGAGQALEISAVGLSGSKWEVTRLGGADYLTPKPAEAVVGSSVEFSHATTDMRVGAAIGVAGDFVGMNANNINLRNEQSNTTGSISKQATRLLILEGSDEIEIKAVGSGKSIIFDANGIAPTMNGGLSVTSIVSTDANGCLQTDTLTPADIGAATTGDLASYVPYTGATADVDLGANYLTVNAILLDGAPSAPVEGNIWYDTTTKTLCVKSDIAGQTLNVGQEEIVRAVNISGAQINNGKVVYISSAFNAFPQINLADNTAAATAENTIGLVTADIADSSVGYVCTAGVVRDINTSAFNIGDRLYLGTAGGLTATKPTGTAIIIPLGIVLTKDAATGTVLVDVQSPSHLADLHDVNDGTPTLNYFLKGDGSRWSRFDLFGTANTWSGTQTFNNSVTIGDASSDTLTVNATSLLSANIGYSNEMAIFANTVDTADTKRIQIGGGGTSSSTRGAYFSAHGNECTTGSFPGGVLLARAGAVAGTYAEIGVAGTGGATLRIDYDNRTALIAAINTAMPTDLADYSLDVVGNLRSQTLAGSGTRMVVTDANGLLSSQAIPSGGASQVVERTTGNLTVGATTTIVYYTGTGGHTITFPAAANTSLRNIAVDHAGSGVLTIDNATDTFQGAASYTLAAGDCPHFYEADTNVWRLT